MRWLLDFIRPPEDADWKKVTRWRWNVCLILIVLVAYAIVAATPLGYAKAGETERKIAAAIEPIAKEQKEQRTSLDNLSKLITEQLAASLATQIRAVTLKRCKVTGSDERDELTREIDRLQDLFIGYKGSRYSVPSCAEL
jgi:hypothetical protein